MVGVVGVDKFDVDDVGDTGTDSIFVHSNKYEWAVGVLTQHNSNEFVDARIKATRAAVDGTSTSKYHKSLQQTYLFYLCLKFTKKKKS